jgi:hypothetical protein
LWVGDHQSLLDLLHVVVPPRSLSTFFFSEASPSIPRHFNSRLGHLSPMAITTTTTTQVVKSC